MRLRPPLALEIAAARGVAALSRRVGAGGGTTIPGKLLAKLDRGAIDRLAARLASGYRRRLGHERQDDHDRDGGRDPPPAAPARPQRRGREPRLGRRLHAAQRRRRRSRAVRGGRGARCPSCVQRLRPRAVCLGNLFRDQLDRYGELELVAERWRERRGRAARRTRSSSTTPTTRSSRRSAEAPPGSVAFGLDDPRVARPSLQHAADSKYCVRCGTPYEYAAAYVGHLGDYRCPRGDHAPAAARGRRAGHRRCTGSSAPRSGSTRPRDRARRARACPASTTSTTRSRPRRSRARSARRSTRSPPGSSASRPRSAASSASRSATSSILLLLIKNPAGANEAVRTLVDGGAPRVLVVALNDEIADGRDVSWIWDVDFEPLLAGPRDARGERRPRRRARAPLPLRRPRRGRRSRSSPISAARSTAGSS